jgi:preprotein translocase subunit SecG
MLPIIAQTTALVLATTIGLVVVSLFLILSVIVQKPRGGGLAGAFSGGAGAQADSAFGAQASNVAVTATIAAFVIFLLLAIAINLMLGGAETSPVTPAIEPLATKTTNSFETTNTATPLIPFNDLPGEDDDLDTLPSGGSLSLPSLPAPESATPAPTPAPANTETPATDGDSQTPADDAGNGN